MQTTIVIYLVMWVLLIVPLLGFNMKRMSEKKLGMKRRIKWGSVVIFASITILISVFLLYAYKVTIETRYELAAERYIDLHAECVTGRISYDQFLEESASMLTDNSDTRAMQEQLSSSANVSTRQPVRFQIGSWITPKYYQGNDIFPDTKVIDANNPVFLIYLFDDGHSQTYYMLEMVWSNDGGWEIAYHAPATDAQYQAEKSTLPSLINGKWFTVSP